MNFIAKLLKFAVPRKKNDYEKRIGSGRLNNNYNAFEQPPQLFRYPNPNREKTGREFCEPRSNYSNNKQPDAWNVNYFNPVNRDHRRLWDEASVENEPEWVKNGPVSRLDTIDLHGFHDDHYLEGHSSTSRPQGRSTPAKIFSSELENNNNENKENKFRFDEFLGSNGSTDTFFKVISQKCQVSKNFSSNFSSILFSYTEQ